MSSKLLTLVVLGLLANVGAAQTWSDGFESYGTGYLCYQDPALVPGAPCSLTSVGNSGGWDGWFNNPIEAGVVVNSPGTGSNGSDQYLDVSPGLACQDAVYPWKENATTGAGAASGATNTTYPTSGGWTLSSHFRIPSGGLALGNVYFIFLNDYNNAGTATSWAGQNSIVPDPANPGSVIVNDDFGYGTGGAPVGNLAEDVWHQIRYDICLDSNTANGYIDQAGGDGVLGTADDITTLISSRVYAGGGPVEIACLDLFSAGGMLHYDNCSLAPNGPWETNSSASSIDINGGPGSACVGSHSLGCVGTSLILNSSATAGAGYDMAVTFANSVPAYLTTGGGQQVNVDINHPSLFNFNGGTPNFAGLLNILPHPGAFSFAVPTGAPILASAQQLVVSAAHADGFDLSQACEVDIQPGGSTPMVVTLPDDGSVQVLLSALNPCSTSIAMYGTSYTDLYVCSNGWINFTAGNSDFTATYTEWATQEPRMGFQSDLEPNNFGTVTVTNNGSTGAGDWVVASYANVTEWGTGGLGVTSYDITFHGPNGHSIENFTTDGTWGVSGTCMGISNGNLGTDPGGPVSFDAATGLGLQASAQASDCVVDANIGGMILNSNGFTSMQFPLFDGSAYLIQ